MSPCQLARVWLWFGFQSKLWLLSDVTLMPTGFREDIGVVCVVYIILIDHLIMH